MFLRRAAPGEHFQLINVARVLPVGREADAVGRATVERVGEPTPTTRLSVKPVGTTSGGCLPSKSFDAGDNDAVESISVGVSLHLKLARTFELLSAEG